MSEVLLVAERTWKHVMMWSVERTGDNLQVRRIHGPWMEATRALPEICGGPARRDKPLKRTHNEKSIGEAFREP